MALYSLVAKVPKDRIDLLQSHLDECQVMGIKANRFLINQIGKKFRIHIDESLNIL